jgi:hypothetical protein
MFSFGVAQAEARSEPRAHPSVGLCQPVELPPPVAWAPPTKLRSSFEVQVQVDEDKVPDLLRVERASGRRTDNVTVRLTLSTQSEPVVVHHVRSRRALVSRTTIPEALRAPEQACALALVERVLFGRVTEMPDPSLAWLLQQKKTLRWIPGPVDTPPSYALRVRAMSDMRVARGGDALVTAADEDQRLTIDVAEDAEAEDAGASAARDTLGRPTHWLAYDGAAHTRRPGETEAEPYLLAAEGAFVLLGTEHGVVLTTRDRGRHAWVYVFEGGQLVRWRTVQNVRLDGDIAMIDVRDGLPSETRRVWVDLTSGEVFD